MNRQNGYYWVREGAKWGIAEWRGDRWWLCGTEWSGKDKDLDEIIETAIQRPKPDNSPKER